MGVDVDPEQVRAARASFGDLPSVQFEAQDATRLAFPDDQFDLVASFMTTHHIPDWPLAVEEMCRVLKPGGGLIFVDMACPIWLARVGEAIGFRSVGFPTAAGLDELFERRGCETVHRSRTMGHYETVRRLDP